MNVDYLLDGADEMEKSENRIEFADRRPIVYIDSSVLLRTPNIDFRNLTMKFARQNPDIFFQSLETIKNLSNNESEYYERIIQLQRYGVISTVITLETANQVILSNSFSQVALFGSVENIKIFPSFITINEPKDLILWNEKIHFRNYNDATLTIANAENLIVDTGFLKTNVGESLLKNVSSTCNVILLSNYSKDIGLIGTQETVEFTPQEFIEKLFNNRCSYKAAGR